MFVLYWELLASCEQLFCPFPALLRIPPNPEPLLLYTPLYQLHTLTWTTDSLLPVSFSRAGALHPYGFTADSPKQSEKKKKKQRLQKMQVVIRLATSLTSLSYPSLLGGCGR
jgi:hypothetical protein